uniref:Sulfotransferase n=1 Tax=Melopsittacus undulatus TaxID=13146 RepID=A0A8C6ISU9_MELUD
TLVLGHQQHLRVAMHGTLGEILEIFTDGRVAYGSWYKHVWGWWERKQKKQLLSLFCDNMKKMRVQEILWFLGKEVVQGMVVRILHHRSFGHMRKNPAANYEAMCTALMDHSLSPFLWKGISRNWKNHFTVAQHYWEQHPIPLGTRLCFGASNSLVMPHFQPQFPRL